MITSYQDAVKQVEKIEALIRDLNRITELPRDRFHKALIDEDSSIESINTELEQTFEEAFSQCHKSIVFAANRYGIKWNEDSRKNDSLKTIVRDFKRLVYEKNKEHLNRLKELLKQVQSSSLKKDIRKRIEEIRHNRSKLIYSDTDILLLHQKNDYLLKRKVIEIQDSSSEKLSITELYKWLTIWTKPHESNSFDKQEVKKIHPFKKEFAIEKWLKNQEKISKEIASYAEKVTNYYNKSFKVKGEDSHRILMDYMQKVSNLNLKKEHLKSKILSRVDQLSKPNFKQERDQLLKVLFTFFLSVQQFKSQDIPWDMRDKLEQKRDAIVEDAIIKLGERKFPSNKAQLKKFLNQFKNESLSPEQIQELLQPLIPDVNNANIETIILISNLKNQLQNSLIFSIQQFCILDRRIDKDSLEIQKNIDETILKLHFHLDIYQSPNLQYPAAEIIKQRMSEELGQQKLLLKKHSEIYVNKIGTNTQSPNFLKKLVEIIDFQEGKIDELHDLKHQYAPVYEETNKHINQLSMEYKTERGIFISQLRNEIKDTDIALNLVFSKIATDELLKPHRDYLQGIELSSEAIKKQFATRTAAKLKDIEEKIRCTKVQLKGLVDLVREKLRQNLRKDFDFSQQAFEIPALSDTNPLKEDIHHLKATLLESAKQIEIIYARFLQCGPSSLQKLNKDFQEEVKKSKETFDLLVLNIEKGVLIKNRMNSLAYKTSETILTTIKNELIRIRDESIDAAIKSAKKRPEQLEILAQIKIANIETIILNQNSWKNALNIVDPQLMYLLNIHADFKARNEKYISKDIAIKSDIHFQKDSEKEYINDLLNTVQKHLRNDHMEDISNNKLSSLTQWIRKNILKPIQGLKHSMIGDRNRLFTTARATKTEKMLVQLGNEVYSNLGAVLS